MKQRLELRQRAGLGLTPGMQTSLALLRLPRADLIELIERELARNPFLRRAGSGMIASGGDDTPADQLVARADSFQQSLCRQLARMGLDRRTESLAVLLVGELRDDGLLDVPLAELAAELSLSEADLAPALTALQHCDPPGVGARDLAECLVLQLLALGLDRNQAQATVDHMALFAARNWTAIRRVMGLGRPTAEARAALLQRLTPRPVDPGDIAPPLRPDLVALRQPDGSVTVRALHETLPRLVLDPRLMRERFAPDLLVEARAMIAALAARGRTLDRIGAWLASAQAGFFQNGPAALAPATRLDLAAALGLHHTTVGRALAGKAIDVDGRLWPLGFFFSAALPGADGAVSARAVQRRIADLVAAEPRDAPLSDAALTERLLAEGVDIARRTVAKYRQGLRIPSSAARRRNGAIRSRTGA